MAFRFKPHEPVEKGVKRLIRREVDKGLSELDRCGSVDDEVVHGVRKRLKKVRAVLRLVREDLGEKTFRKENSFFRDAARPLTDVRDSKVLIDALDKLTSFGTQVSAEEMAGLRAFLVARNETVCHHVLEEERACDTVAAALIEAKKRIGGWSLACKGWSTVDRGLKRVYRSGYAALAVASADRGDGKLHEWRKQAKYFGHQLQLFEAIWRNVAEELARPVQDLTQQLGDDHDLSVLDGVLGDVVPNESANLGEGAILKARQLIGLRREELQRNAFELGHRIYRDGPKATIDRIRGWRRAWQRESVLTN